MIHSCILVHSSFSRIAAANNNNNNNNAAAIAEFEEFCTQTYLERDIASKTLSKLTPFEVAIALYVELTLFKRGESVFEQTVYSLLSALPVAEGKYTLDLPKILREYIETCDIFCDKEFARATFDSLYRTWTDKDNFDRNYNLTGKEAYLLADEANFSQLLKTWIFFMSEHHNRFFYTYDPRCSETDKAYYTVLGDGTKRKRTNNDFVTYLCMTRPIFAQVCMISSDKSEIHQVFAKATSESRTFFENRRIERDAKRALRKKGTKKAEKAERSEPAPPPAKPFMTLAERHKRLSEAIKAFEERKAAPPAPRVVAAPVPSVWKKPETKKVEPVAEPVAEPEKVEPEEDDFVEVKGKSKPSPTINKKVVKNRTGRLHRVFAEE